MVVDVLPELLKNIQADFEAEFGRSDIVDQAFKTLKAKKATFINANAFAIEVGRILSETLGAHLSASSLPDGKMYYNIAHRLLSETLGRNFEIISGYATDVQSLLNEQANIHLKVQVPKINQDRIDGLVNRLSSENHFEDVRWLVGEPIVNFSQSIIDDVIEANASFHHDVGLSPQIVRKPSGFCCKWCQEVVGTYTYPKVPKDVYRRHQHCQCIVDYHPGNGRKQNVHTKRWSDPQKSARIELRKHIGMTVQAGAKNYFRDESNDDILPKNFIKAEKHAFLTYDRIKNSNQDLEKRKIYSNLGNFKEMRNFTKKDIDIAFNHVFNEIHELREGRKLFDPEINMAHSWERLISGKNIQPHDLILLKHERLEHDYMYETGKMDYDTAHAKTNETFDYGLALQRYLERKNNGNI